MQVLEDTSDQVEAIGRQTSNSISKVCKHKKEKSKSLNDARQKESNAGPRSPVGNVSGYRCVSDCRSRGHEFDPGPVPYFPSRLIMI